jgi:putative flippase GtrA
MDWNTLVKGCIQSDVATLACIPAVIANILSAAIAFGGIIATAFVIWGGYKYIRSGGDPKQVDTARQTITYAIIGLVIVMLAYFILWLISRLTGVECLSKFSFSGCSN